MPVDTTTNSAPMDYSSLMNNPGMTRVAKKNLGQEDFLKLLAVQFQTQDPMKPMEDTAFIAQMAQFTSLEQASATTAQMTLLKNGQDIVTANSYIGHQLTFNLGKGATATGQVEGVEIIEGNPRLIVGDKTYSLSSVILVQPAPVPPANPPATN
jgi:flagellar basal-body rod modification protein FlgD